MKMKVQLVVCAEDGREEARSQEIAVVEKACTNGSSIWASRWPKQRPLLKMLQQHLVEQQATAFVAAHAQCDHCGKSLGIKGYHTRTFRTLFGTVTLTSPRLYHCRCRRPQDHHFPAAERPADQLGRSRAPLDGNEMGLARLIWSDGPGAQGFSADRRHTQRDHGPEWGFLPKPPKRYISEIYLQHDSRNRFVSSRYFGVYQVTWALNHET